MNEVWVVIVRENGLEDDEPDPHVFDSEKAAYWYIEETRADERLELSVFVLRLDVLTLLPPTIGKGIISRASLERMTK